MRRLAASTAIGITILSITPIAGASPESDAKDLFARGRDLRANSDCGSAVTLFRKAWAVYPQGLGSLRNVAECEELLGHFASSRRAWLDLKRALITAPNDAKYEGWDRDSEEIAARLKPKVATFVVDVYVKSPEGEALANDMSGVEIFVNGESIGTALVGTPLERDPGAYRIRAQVAEAQPVEQKVEVAAGDNPHVTIRLTVVPKPKVTTEDHSGRRTIGYVVAGFGAAALIGSGITFLVRDGALDDLDRECPGRMNCVKSQSLSDTIDTGKAMSTLTSILLPIGAVGLVGGTVLILTSGSSSSEPAKTERAFLRIAPTLGGLSLSGKF